MTDIVILDKKDWLSHSGLVRLYYYQSSATAENLKLCHLNCTTVAYQMNVETILWLKRASYHSSVELADKLLVAFNARELTAVVSKLRLETFTTSSILPELEIPNLVFLDTGFIRKDVTQIHPFGLCLKSALFG